MKKFLFFLMAAVVFANGAAARHNCGCEGCEICKVEDKLRHKQKNKGGFMEAGATPVSVAQILSLPDDTRVMVVGYIVDRLGNGEYTFTDGSDSMVAVIGKKDWKGQIVTPKDKVILKGKVIQDDDDVSLDVKSVKVLQ